MSDATEDFLKTYSRALQSRNAAVFAGAGMSQAAGYVDWRTLLHEIAADIGLDIAKEHDLVSVAQYHVNEKGGRGKLNQLLLNEFTANSKRTENHVILSRLPIDTYWTTNYDPLIEQSLEDADKKVDVKRTQASLATTLLGRDVVVYKMHGDVSTPEEAVLTKDDYETFNEKRKLFTVELQGDLVSKTFVFIGFSFDDPNLEYILSRIRVLLGKNQRPHFCFFRRPKRADYPSETEFAYAQVKQELRIKDLIRFAIYGVLVDEYQEITALLHKVENRYRRRKVLVSGSAVEYGPWSADLGLAFVQKLGRALASDFEIVSGFGAGVGSAILNGVLEHLDAAGEQDLDGHITLRPFPRFAADPGRLPALRTAYRNRMAALAGTALFLFGNRRGNGTVVDAPGVREEFDIAAEHRLMVVPVGATGYVAHELWERVLADFNQYYPNLPQLKPQFEAIGRTGLTDTDLITAVVRLLRDIRDT